MAIHIKSKVIKKLSIRLNEGFVKGKSNILRYLWQEDGLLLSEYTIFSKTGMANDTVSIVSVSLNGVKTFSLKIEAEVNDLHAFNSSINFASNMQCPIILKLNGEMLTATFFESKVPENTSKVENFFTSCIGL